MLARFYQASSLDLQPLAQSLETPYRADVQWSNDPKGV